MSLVSTGKTLPPGQNPVKILDARSLSRLQFRVNFSNLSIVFYRILPPAEPHPRDSEWTTLSQAAEQLGVHPATLRRWADMGQVPALLTPGGHRRFRDSDLRAFAERNRHEPKVEAREMWAGQAMTHVRHEVQRSSSEWGRYSPAEREDYRKLGQDLVGVAIHYIAESAPSEELLDEARSIGAAQARLAIRNGHGLTEALAAALFFRDALIEAALRLPESTRSNPEPHACLLRRINTVLNSVQLAIGDVYERALGGPK